MMTAMKTRPGANPWRIAGWGIAGAVLLVPLIAMRFTDEVRWDVADFVFAGVLIALTGIAFEVGIRASASAAYRTAIGIALAASFLLIWINLAVGIIGSEDNPANLIYAAVLGVALLGVGIARLRARSMAMAMAATSVAQLLAGAFALYLGHFTPVITAVFMVFWLVSAGLFGKAAAAPTP